MEPINNNIFEVKPDLKSKRKRMIPSSNAFLNPALDFLAKEDPMCNNAMEITPNKRRKRTKSCNIISYENTALDLGISKAAVNEFLARELENVRRNVRMCDTPVKVNNITNAVNEPLYANVTEITNTHNTVSADLISEEPIFHVQNDTEHSALNTTNELDSDVSILEQKSLNVPTTMDLDMDLSAINNVTNIQNNVTNQIFVNNSSNLNLSFVDRLTLDSPCGSNQLYLDDDLNESNIMEIKTITIVTKKKRIPRRTCTNPFLDPNLDTKVDIPDENPFLNEDISNSDIEYNIEVLNRPVTNPIQPVKNMIPRTLFTGDTNSTISTVNESTTNIAGNEYENIDSFRSESPIYENIDDIPIDDSSNIYNKQSKILGHDVSRFSALDIMNLNKNNTTNCSNESSDSKKDLKHIFKVSNKLSRKVFKTLKKTFKGEKVEQNVTLNPYEVPRKPQKLKAPVKEIGIENPGLRLDNSDEIEIEEIIDEENQYETVKTLRNTRLNMNVTPLKERCNEAAEVSTSKSNTPGKKVRFDSTLNQEKIITGDSFDGDIQSPGLDAKIDMYHDELENCINERKFLQHNM